MDNNTINEENEKQLSPKQEIDWINLIRKLRASLKLILAACCLGIVVSVIIISGTPKEYTASTLVAPEGYRRDSSSGLSALAGMASTIPSRINVDVDKKKVMLSLSAR